MKRSLAVLLWLASSVAFCQLPTSTLIGRVSDPQQASVAAEKVTVTNEAHDVSLTTTTDAEGRYSFPLLKVGAHSLRVESPNFAESRVDALVLEAGKVQTCDVSLALAGAKESVVVSSSNQSIDTSQSMIQGQTAAPPTTTTPAGISR